jgi:FemAB-related protein (PEP-CTERM system-associated)
MNLQIKVYSSESESAWDNYVGHHSDTTIFHRAGWKGLIERSMGYPGSYLMALENGQIVGIYPLFILSTRLFGTMGISLPFVNYGGIAADCLEVERLLTDEAETIGRAAGCSYIELRQRYPLKSELPATDRKVVSVIPLQEDPERVFSRLHQNVRNKIRKTQKNGVTVQQGAEYLSEFYRIYSRNLRDLGTPVLTRRFFEAVVETFPHNVRVYLAIRYGKTIGAKVVLVDRDTCYFVWSATIREDLCYAPVHALNWKAIEDACSDGCKRIDFGRSTTESSHHNFKKYWGVESQTLPWVYQLLDCNQIPGLHKENQKFAAAIALWKRLPLFLSRILGPAIARRLP